MEVSIVQKKNEAIPACITNLKALKALCFINFEQPNPIIIESINSFIECLKKFFSGDEWRNPTHKEFLIREVEQFLNKHIK